RGAASAGGNSTSASPSCSSSSSSSSSNSGGGQQTEFYALAEAPDLCLPLVKGVSRDKKSKRWAVYYKGQRHYFYDKNCGGCKEAYTLAVHLRRQQVEEVEIIQVYEEQLQQMQQGAPGHCIRKQQLPSQLQQQDLLDLLRQLLLLQLTSVKDLLLQTGLWKAIISQPPADQQQELQQQQQQQQQQQEQQELQHDALTSAKADIPAAAAADTVAAAASAFAAAADKEIATEAAEETGMCMDS
ncbi:hypothetical protein, conserved, partial [Eimeria acervulina]